MQALQAVAQRPDRKPLLLRDSLAKYNRPSAQWMSDLIVLRRQQLGKYLKGLSGTPYHCTVFAHVRTCEELTAVITRYDALPGGREVIDKAWASAFTSELPVERLFTSPKIAHDNPDMRI